MLEPSNNKSLSESFRTIKVPEGVSLFKKFFAFVGPGMMVAVGYMDPGNWATDIVGGAKYGYTLISIIFISNLFAMLMQHLSLKLGVASGRDLAQACRDNFSKPVSIILWIFCEIAIAACDLAEVLGTAIALQLLFGLPLFAGVIITVFDVFIILFLQQINFRYLEVFIGSLMFIILSCFVFELMLSKPDLALAAQNLIPKSVILTDTSMLLIAIGILGATVMPHNLYLHSSIVQTRAYKLDYKGKKEAIKWATLDSTISLFLAFFVNAAILILAASGFHEKGITDVDDIGKAHMLLEDLLGNKWAPTAFAIALLAAGQNSTITGTMAGQIVMEGFINIRLKPWLRRILTRLVAIVPALIVVGITGNEHTTDMLILSQVILSMQLSFAIIPLVLFTSNKVIMGEFANSKFLGLIAWIIAIIIAMFNIFLVFQTLTS
jgi:manganese transport protein